MRLVLASDLLDSSRTFVKRKIVLAESVESAWRHLEFPVVVALGNHDAGHFARFRRAYYFRVPLKRFRDENEERVAFNWV